MTLHLRAGVAIKAPAARVFDLVSTPERLPEWNVSVERAARRVPGEPVQLGTRAIFTGRLLGQPLESETEVVQFEPPLRMVTQAIRGPRLRTTFDLQEGAQGTLVKVEVSGDVPGGALGARLAEGFLRRELAVSLERLRGACEA